jgi:hypothetical protein
MTARDSDRVVLRSSGGGLFESSIYPVEHGAGALRVGRTELGAARIGPHTKGIVVGRRHSILHEHSDDARHALSREPEDTTGN